VVCGLGVPLRTLEAKTILPSSYSNEIPLRLSPSCARVYACCRDGFARLAWPLHESSRHESYIQPCNRCTSLFRRHASNHSVLTLLVLGLLSMSPHSHLYHPSFRNLLPLDMTVVPSAVLWKAFSPSRETSVSNFHTLILLSGNSR
jgi:hypothetical protein